LEVADRLAETIPIRWGVSSKAERGYALAEQRPKARAATAEEIVLAKKICAAESFAAIGLSCLRQVTLNEDQGSEVRLTQIDD
jgi:inorganic triphosphatase YgiF